MTDSTSPNTAALEGAIATLKEQLLTARAKRLIVVRGLAADPSSKSQLHKIDQDLGKLTIELGALEEALEDAQREAAALARQARLDASEETRQRAVAGAVALTVLGGKVDAAFADVIHALSELRKAGMPVGEDATSALQVLVPEEGRYLSELGFVLGRANARGPEMAAAVGHWIKQICDVAGGEISGYVAINHYGYTGLSRIKGTVTDALQESAEYIAARLQLGVPRASTQAK